MQQNVSAFTLAGCFSTFQAAQVSIQPTSLGKEQQQQGRLYYLRAMQAMLEVKPGTFLLRTSTILQRNV